MPLFVQQPQATSAGEPLATPGSSASSQVSIENALENAQQSQRELAYNNLKLKKLKHEITDTEYLTALESIKGSATSPTEMTKWDTAYASDKQNIFLEGLGLEDKEIQLKYSTDEDANYASSAYSILADKAQAAGEVEVALGYRLKAQAMASAGSSGSGRGSSGYGSSSTKVDDSSYSELKTIIKNNGVGLTNLLNDIEANENLNEEAKAIQKDQLFKSYTANIYSLLNTDTYKNYVQNASTSTKRNEALKLGLNYASLLTKYNDDDVLKTLSDTTGRSTDELRSIMIADPLKQAGAKYYGLEKEDITAMNENPTVTPFVGSSQEATMKAGLPLDGQQQTISSKPQGGLKDNSFLNTAKNFLGAINPVSRIGAIGKKIGLW